MTFCYDYSNTLPPLRNFGIGCRIGSEFFGIFVYADDIFLLSASRPGLQAMVSMCEKFASEHNLKFEIFNKSWSWKETILQNVGRQEFSQEIVLEKPFIKRKKTIEQTIHKYPIINVKLIINLNVLFTVPNDDLNKWKLAGNHISLT